MKIHRILAIIIRNLYTFRRNYDRIFDAFWWPTMELVVWGITSKYIMQLSTNNSNILFLIVSGLTFWFVVGRSQYEINVALLEEVWSRNLINIFVSPITFSEWVFSTIIIGLLKASISFIAAIIVAYILYAVKIFVFGFYLIPFIFLLVMTGWWTSFLITGIILRFGSRVQTLAWTLIYILAPLSAIYYPITTLPESAQIISFLLPTTYVFQGIRELITTGQMSNELLIKSFFLNIFYISLSLLYLKSSFTFLQQKGMSQLQ
jgi:ABC-2 type transport system permease protein